MGQRRYDEALRAFDECLSLNPRYALALLAKARIFHWRGDDSAALAEINRVVSRIDTARWEPAIKSGYLNDRVDLYRNLGRFDESEQDARRSIELCPSQVDAYLAMALLEKLRGKALPEVEVWYDRMVKANPISPDVHLRLAEFYRDLGRWDQALNEVHQARSLNSERGPALAELLRASIVAAQGDYRVATTQVESILQQAGRTDGKMLYAAASALSLASRSATMADDSIRAKALGDRATELLQATLNQGYHDINYQEQERMIVDPSLEPIRSRPEVRRLLSFLP
jgi:tetratricopeptide (TPR) repeat protein